MTTMVLLSSVRGFLLTKTSYNDLQSVAPMMRSVRVSLNEGQQKIISDSRNERKAARSIPVSHALASAERVLLQTRLLRLDFQSISNPVPVVSVILGSAMRT